MENVKLEQFSFVLSLFCFEICCKGNNFYMPK